MDSRLWSKSLTRELLEVLSSEGLVWDEQEKIGEDDTSRISPEETLMTKNRGGPTTSTSSIVDKRQYDREISFRQPNEGDVPSYQVAERVQWDTAVIVHPSTDMFNRVLYTKPHHRHHKHTITSHRTNTISTHGPLPPNFLPSFQEPDCFVVQPKKKPRRTSLFFQVPSMSIPACRDESASFICFLSHNLPPRL